MQNYLREAGRNSVQKIGRKPLISIIPGRIRRDPDLSPLQKIICGVINIRGGATDATNSQLADLIDVHSSTIARNLRELDVQGYIDRKGSGSARVIHLTADLDGADGKVYITKELIECDDLSMSERYLLARVYGLARRRGYAFIKSRTLAHELGTSRQAVQNKLKSLREAGYIITTTQNRRHIHPTQKTEDLIEPEPTTKTDTLNNTDYKGVKHEQRNTDYRRKPSENPKKKGLTKAIQSIVDQLDTDPDKPLAIIFSTKKKAKKLRQGTGVDLDRDHLRTVVFLTSEDIQEVIDVYQSMTARNPSAAIQSLLTRSVNGELNNAGGREISFRAESLAEEKTNALLQSEGHDPDQYMAILFDEKPSVANRAYGAALDVVLNGEARNPLKLFTYYANRIMDGEGLPDYGDDSEDSPDRCHRKIAR